MSYENSIAQKDIERCCYESKKETGEQAAERSKVQEASESYKVCKREST